MGDVGRKGWPGSAGSATRVQLRLFAPPPPFHAPVASSTRSVLTLFSCALAPPFLSLPRHVTSRRFRSSFSAASFATLLPTSLAAHAPCPPSSLRLRTSSLLPDTTSRDFPARAGTQLTLRAYRRRGRLLWRLEPVRRSSLVLTSPASRPLTPPAVPSCSRALGNPRRAIKDFASFLTAMLVSSAFALPLIFAHTGLIAPAACWMSLTGGALVYGTILVFTGVFVRPLRYRPGPCLRLD